MQTRCRHANARSQAEQIGSETKINSSESAATFILRMQLVCINSWWLVERVMTSPLSRPRLHPSYCCSDTNGFGFSRAIQPKINKSKGANKGLTTCLGPTPVCSRAINHLLPSRIQPQSRMFWGQITFAAWTWRPESPRNSSSLGDA